MKGVMSFGKRDQLSPRYIGPFEILECAGPIEYRLALPLIYLMLIWYLMYPC